ncbi:LacI family transcriptional regulator [Deinococcus indicus]|uniref:LacI family DNA-binding transcriptional regulator n=1 Tax=Deinococcus indicus TaxID=223556 RepID=UPI00174D4CE2|nr:LacI family DNA-binding transcriptional regulator [Deinococcus indicus]GHG33103.1 LacI family transcriptional regulator [Deinococcus indicus]
MPKASPQQAATIHDVAQRAGVSYQTVSRVINNHVNVAVPTRTRVLQAIEDLNYRPSLLAKSLVTRRSGLLGVVAYGTEQFGPSQVAQSIERSARSQGYEILRVTLREYEKNDMLSALSRLQQFGVDGMILLSPYNAHDIVRDLTSQVPFILVDGTTDVDGTTVSIDQFEGAALAVEHLLDLGHQQVLHISGPQPWSDAELRFQGYIQTMQRRGLPVLPRLEGDWSPASGHAAVRQALDMGLQFTAVFAANDQMALGALNALKGAGLSIPGDVSVVGFDDTPEAAYYDPPLTTVVQDFGLLGRKSFEELLRMIDQPQTHQRHIMFQPQLRLRSSTAAPR